MAGSLGNFQFLSLLLFLHSSLVTIVYSRGDFCQALSCSRDGPSVRFPFRLKGRHHPDCGYDQGFDLSCEGDDTIIHIPSLLQHVSVKYIDYGEQKLGISDSKGCIWSLLSDIDLSTSNFSFAYEYEDITFLKCSKDSQSSASGCLIDREHAVSVISADYYLGWVPVSCQPIKTVASPYEHYWGVSASSAVDLSWDAPRCGNCEKSGGKCGFKIENSREISCYDQPHAHQGWRKKNVIIGASLGSFLLLATIVICIKVYRRWNLNKKLDLENEIKVEKFLEDYKSLKPTRYSCADLKRVTDQFKEKLGQGAYDSVYKGKLLNGTTVAVKILNNFGGDGEEFINEVSTIGRIHHVNVVRLLGFCADRLKRALVYEFMPNESLEKFIFSKSGNGNFLGWEKLHEISVGIAKGIEYLHQGCDQRILHFDIKPHNILLDQNFTPKISDFGLAKLCSKGQSVVSMKAARGTMGYIAPEVVSRNFGNVSCKSDVYSFGMLLLEMVGGRKNIDVTVENTSRVYFPEWIYRHLNQMEDINLNYIRDGDAMIVKKLAIVALWCIQWYPADRPSMKSVVQMLEGNIESLPMPSNPFASTTSANTDVQSTCTTKLSTIVE